MYPRKGMGRGLSIYVLKTLPIVIRGLQQPFEGGINILSLRKSWKGEMITKSFSVSKFHGPSTTLPCFS